MTSSKAIGDWSSNWMAMSCWPAMVFTPPDTLVSVRSVDDTPAPSAVWMAAEVPVLTFGMLIESVPAGSGRLRTRSAVARPARNSGTYSSTSHSGGTK
jgi:hypothetical protein